MHQTKLTGPLTGRLQLTARGGGFLLRGNDQPDLYIAPEHLCGAMDGDLVRAEAFPPAAGEARPSGGVTEVLERAHTQAVGTVHGDELTPDERRLPSMQLRYAKGEARLPDGMKAVALIDRYPDGARPMLGHIVEILGQKGQRGVDIKSVIRRCGIRDRFPQETLSAAARTLQRVEARQTEGRRDLRETVTFTIDGRSSRDFDDAVSIRRLDNGDLLLGVHIADVSAYVPEGGALDREARLRGTSVYFPFYEKTKGPNEKQDVSQQNDPLETGVIPMLPEALSTGVCSLNPGEDRLTLSCCMRVDRSGAVIGSEIVETVIRSHYRLAYEDVTAMLEGPGTSAKDGEGRPFTPAGIAALRERYAGALPSLELLMELYKTLSARRIARGGVDFDLPESAITIDEDGRAAGLSPAERGVANRIIEECMLLANETVAKTMLGVKAPILYRVHEKPDGDRMAAFNTFLKTLGYPPVPHPDNPTPKAVAAVLTLCKGKPEEALIGKIALRSMQKARYGELCLGHFGLALSEYCHFTSPIRRYPDLFVHRVVKLWLHGGLDKERERLAALAPKLAEETSAAERAAMEAERGVDDLKKCEYMAAFIGSEYRGVVSGVTNFGLFVELPNTAEGMIRLSAFTDDYYECEPERYRIVGRRHGRVIRLGDALRVIVNSVDLDGPTIDFLPKSDYHEQKIIYNPDKSARKGRTAGEKRRGRTLPQKGGKRHATRKGHKGAGPKPKGKA